MEKLGTRAGQSPDKELQKIGGCIYKAAVPADRGVPIMDALLEPVEDLTHVVGDMVKPIHVMRYASQGFKYHP